MPNFEGRGGVEPVKPAQSPEKLLPTHIGGELETETQTSSAASSPELSPEKKYEKRAKGLRRAPDLEKTLREYLESRGREVPENVNLSLAAIEEFQKYVREAQDLREVIKHTTVAKERRIALGAYARKKVQIEEYLAQGKTFEAAYREYISNRNEYIRFKSALKEVRGLTNLLSEPSFKGLDDETELDEEAFGRLEALMRKSKAEPMEEEERAAALEALKTVHPEDSEEYKALAAEMEMDESETGPVRTKKDIADEIEARRKEIEELWGNPMVRYFTNSAEIQSLMEDYHKGEAVLETQSIIKNLNKLHEWEQQHQRTTIGGVLVGPPGVGKTTLVRHYLEAKDRPEYAYIDLSEDVTRYLLYGSKSIEFKNPTDFYTTLSDNLARLNTPEDMRQFVEENAKTLSSVFNVKGDEATVVFLAQLQESLARGTKVEGVGDEVVKVGEKVQQLVDQAFRKELANEFAHVVKRNGWRDGMVIAALRRGESVIFDEFNKNKNWSLIYSLMTAEPGKTWYFADNDEHIKIPDDWRMYFTANIGTRHGGTKVPEALASRAGGKVIEVDYPSKREELLVALTALSNPGGIFLRSNEDLSKLFVLIHDVFPSMRNYLEDQKQSIPISFRTVRDIAEKLVLTRDPKTKVPVYQATGKSFDEAVYEVAIDSYALYDDKEAPREWVKTLTSLGLLLDDKVKDRVVAWIGEADYEERRKKFEGMKDDFKKVADKIKGITRNTSADMAIPDQTNF